MSKNIGLDIIAPTKICTDTNCPFHGNLKIRGQVLVGKVISNKMSRSVVIERKYEKLINKYQRYEKRKTKTHVHNPDCINAKVGDIVIFAECRPISKTKSFVVVQIKDNKI